MCADGLFESFAQLGAADVDIAFQGIGCLPGAQVAGLGGYLAVGGIIGADGKKPGSSAHSSLHKSLLPGGVASKNDSAQFFALRYQLSARGLVNRDHRSSSSRLLFIA